jgi:hypothetical protein
MTAARSAEEPRALTHDDPDAGRRCPESVKRSESRGSLAPPAAGARPRPLPGSLRGRSQAMLATDVLTIGAPGFEPGTSATQRRRATRLRHAPI